MEALPPRGKGEIDNSFYDSYGERWYTAQDDPVALLRAEAEVRDAWVLAELADAFPGRAAKVLDVGCGAGFLSNALARAGHEVTGLDGSPKTLEVARKHDSTGRVRYEQGDALSLPHPDGGFDAVCAMDFLEHVEEPAKVVAEAARVLATGGLFFFHTFNRNPVSWLLAAKGLEWFVSNTPKNMHVHRLFIKPAELAAMCRKAGLEPQKMTGVRPKLLSWALLRLILTGTPAGLGFTLSRSRLVGYLGSARKSPPR